MKKLTRRSVLKTISKASVLAFSMPFVSSMIGCGDRHILLNVALHGLFVMNITDSGIELLTPEIDAHIYNVGGWDANQFSLIPKGATYNLEGVTPEKTLPFYDWNQVPTFFHSQDNFTVDRAQAHCQVNLPFPTGLKFLRTVTGKEPPCVPSPCTKTIDKDIYSVSLCQVLTYKVPDYQLVKLEGSGWTPHIDWDTHTANLHIWAEPPQRLTSHHANEAYGKLSSMLRPLNLRLRVYSTAPLDRDTGVCGFPPEQEQGWSDWVSGGGEGVHPTNCCAVVVRS